MIFDRKVSLVLRLYDLPNDQSQDIEITWTVLPYFIVPFTGRNMVIKFDTDIDNLNDQNLPRFVLWHVRGTVFQSFFSFWTDSSGRDWIERVKDIRPSIPNFNNTGLEIKRYKLKCTRGAISFDSNKRYHWWKLLSGNESCTNPRLEKVFDNFHRSNTWRNISI